MNRVRRELWLPPAPTPTSNRGEADSGVLGVFIDGLEVGRPDHAKVWLYVQRKPWSLGWGLWGSTTEACVALAVDGLIYELSRGDPEPMRRLGEMVGRHLRGAPAPLHESRVDFDLWQDEGDAAVLACTLAPAVAVAASQYVYHLSPWDMRLLAAGVLALAARVVSGMQRVAVATWPQLLPERFAKLRGGRPALSAPWLRPEGATWLLRLALVLLVATVASIFVGRF
jgi:hypothetical protein